jgi:hypothetical protein
MQISNVSAGAPSAAGSPRSTTPNSAKPTAAATPPAVTPPAVTPPAATPPEASSAAVPPISTIYSTTVGGKSYAGSVVVSEGQYTVSVPNLPGAIASGSTAQEAENSLTVKVDTLA